MELEHYSDLAYNSKNANLKDIYAILKEHATDFFDGIEFDESSLRVTATHKGRSFIKFTADQSISSSGSPIIIYGKDERPCIYISQANSGSVPVIVSDIYIGPNVLILSCKHPHVGENSSYTRHYSLILIKDSDGSILVVTDAYICSAITPYNTSLSATNSQLDQVVVFDPDNFVVGTTGLPCATNTNKNTFNRTTVLSAKYSFAPVLTLDGKTVDNVFFVVSTANSEINTERLITDGTHKYYVFNRIAYRYE